MCVCFATRPSACRGNHYPPSRWAVCYNQETFIKYLAFLEGQAATVKYKAAAAKKNNSNSNNKEATPEVPTAPLPPKDPPPEELARQQKAAEEANARQQALAAQREQEDAHAAALQQEAAWANEAALLAAGRASSRSPVKGSPGGMDASGGSGDPLVDEFEAYIVEAEARQTAENRARAVGSYRMMAGAAAVEGGMEEEGEVPALGFKFKPILGTNGDCLLRGRMTESDRKKLQVRERISGRDTCMWPPDSILYCSMSGFARP